MEGPVKLVVRNIGKLLTLEQEDADPLGQIENAAVVINDGKFVWVGPESQLDPEIIDKSERVLDARGCVAMPGLIDSHTHLVFGGSREEEWARKLSGVPYMQIAAEGGGINATVKATREASEEELYERASKWLDEMLRWGVTTVEAKSGYGLDTESELKILRVLKQLDEDHEVDIIPTFLGAHDFPLEFKDDREAYVRLLVEEMIPAVGEQGIARFCDIFCEEGAFSVEQANSVLMAAQDYGMVPRMHADQFNDSGASGLAAEIGAISAEHLENMSPENIATLKEAGVIAGLLPVCSLYLNYKYPDARQMLDAGLKVTIATDFNPGSAMCANLPFAAQLACMQMKVRFDEALPAITRTAAESLLLSDRIGHVAEGMRGDLLLLDIPAPEYFLYHIARLHTWKVIVRGEVAWENTEDPVFLD